MCLRRNAGAYGRSGDLYRSLALWKLFFSLSSPFFSRFFRPRIWDWEWSRVEVYFDVFAEQRVWLGFAYS